MNSNLLKKWHEELSLQYWKNEDFQNTINISDITSIYNTFDFFFPEESYSTPIGISHINWLKSYLQIFDPQFFGYARLLSAIIDYYEVNERKQYDLKKQSNIKNIDRFRDDLFEWFTNFILTYNSFNNSTVGEYNIGSVNKPLDSYFKFDNKEYIVECVKVYDVRQSSLLKTVTSALYKILIKNSKLVKMQPHIQPCGYIIFKNLSDIKKLQSEIKDSFNEVFKEYLFRMNTKENTIKVYASKETDKYEVFIGSNFFYKFDDNHEKFNDCQQFIKFQCNNVLNQTTHSQFEIKAVNKEDLEHSYKIICERIKRKIEQHKNSEDLHLIIFIEFEQSISVFDSERTFYIDLNRLDKTKFTKYLSDKVSIYFISKRYQNFKIIYDTLFLCNPNFEDLLKYKFEHMVLPH